VISVVILDDHPAVRIGLRAALRSEPGLEPVAAIGRPDELDPLLYRSRPDVVVLDYHLPTVSGLELCRRLRMDVPSPGVVLYSAFADDSLTLPAIVAGAHAIVHKSAAPRELYEAIRLAARGSRVLPRVSRTAVHAAQRELHPDDLVILGLLLEGADRPDIQQALRLSAPELAERLQRMLERLGAPATTPFAKAEPGERRQDA
jgi:DNA-binding NarL/FixJ family response regulator